MSVRKVNISSEEAGQRLDNFLLREFKGVPKSRLYRALRKGEVRVNGKRVKAEYRLVFQDEVRLPPLSQAATAAPIVGSIGLQAHLEQCILYEDADLLVINKPSGLPVHGGTQVSAGLIETLRVMRPQTKFLELVHRLDKETSGCLIVAKKRAVLVELQQQLALRHQIQKQYLALVKGRWQGGKKTVSLPLRKNILAGGERMVMVDQETGREAITHFEPYRIFGSASLLLVTLVTGRTHQVRVHAQALGHPLAGDTKYGDREFNQAMKVIGVNHLFLHAAHLGFAWKDQEKQLSLCAPLEANWHRVLRSLDEPTKKR